MSSSEDPKDYSEAMNSVRATEWIKVMAEGISAFEANDAWEFVAKPVHAKMLHSKWVFKTKKHADCTQRGSRLRVLLVATRRSTV